MNKKNILLSLLVFMSLTATVFLAYPFFNSLSISERTFNESIESCSVKEMVPGDLLECGAVSIYMRTEKDKIEINTYSSLLSDPQSIYSKQPDKALNEWRSENPNYFVFYPYAPNRNCGVSFKEPRNFDIEWYEPQEIDALEELPYFTEQCEGRAWDMSGRLYHRKDYPTERNLTIPKLRWVSSSTVYVHYQ